MNCSLCKYRVQIVGFEEQVGAPQRPHHMQVRGALGSAQGAEGGGARERPCGCADVRLRKAAPM